MRAVGAFSTVRTPFIPIDFSPRGVDRLIASVQRSNVARGWVVTNGRAVASGRMWQTGGS